MNLLYNLIRKGPDVEIMKQTKMTMTKTLKKWRTSLQTLKLEKKQLQGNVRNEKYSIRN